MKKNCTQIEYCSFKERDINLIKFCNYNNYCDFQLPRDSRELKYNEYPMFDGRPLNEK